MALADGIDRSSAVHTLVESRPTAVNLQWAMDRLSNIPDADVLSEVIRIHEEDLAINHAIGRHGAPLLQGGVLTICNTGALATSGHGTALGMIRSAHAASQDIHVYILETRPYLQGARLTAYECMQEGIPCTLITDGMAGALLQSGRVQSTVAGCDRVANNGDTANKLGLINSHSCVKRTMSLYISQCQPPPWIDTVQRENRSRLKSVRRRKSVLFKVTQLPRIMYRYGTHPLM